MWEEKGKRSVVESWLEAGEERTWAWIGGIEALKRGSSEQNESFIL